jgi:autotransporter-associated beta strand protein
LRMLSQQTYTGQTTISSGYLVASTNLDNSLSAASHLVLTAGGSLDISHRPQTVAGISGSGGTVFSHNLAGGSGGVLTLSVTNGEAYSFDGSLGGGYAGFSMVKTGEGTQTLAATNTYTGTTTVVAGKLVVDGSAANSTVTVESGGTLAGSGTVGGIVLNVGGTISPGNSPGALNVAGNVVWNPGANYNWQIYDTTLGAGTGWDLISATGSLDLAALTVGSEFNINLWSLNEIGPDVNGDALNFDPNQNYTWTILTAAGGITGFAGTSQFLINTGAINGTAGFANALNGGTFSIVQNSNDLNLVFTSASAPIPEPGTWFAAALLAGGAAFLRWRKRREVS